MYSDSNQQQKRWIKLLKFFALELFHHYSTIMGWRRYLGPRDDDGILVTHLD